jgi:two-component system sensor histidine kinase YesM
MSRARGTGLGIRAKLFLVFLGLILGPFAVYTGITLYQSARNAERSGRYAARQVLRQAGQFIESRVSVARRALQLVTLDGDVRHGCAGDPAAYRADIGLWVSDAARVRRVLLTVGQTAPDITGFTLYMDAGLAAFAEADDLRALAPRRDEPWHARAVGSERALVWLGDRYFEGGDPGGLVHALARIPDDLDLQRTAGWVRADVPTRIFRRILDEAQLSLSSAAFLVDGQGVPVALSTRAAALDPALRAAAVEAFPPPPLGEEARTLTLGGRRWLADALDLRDTDWRLVLLVPYEDVDAVGKGVRRDMGIAVAIIVPLLVPLAFGLASTATRRIARLAREVRAFEAGNLELRLPARDRDEIGELARELNGMAARIHGLLEDRYRLGKEMKHAEMKALQAQINPHFLYNTLDLVNCLALREQVPAIGEAVEALSRFYRLSLSGGAERVTVAQELEHVETYLRIQNMRFDDGIALTVLVPAEVRAAGILKIVLQPLVENAVLHGIREKETGRGTVTIRGHTLAGAAGPEVVLAVEDDGVGIAAAQLARLLEERDATSEHGYGVRNIDRRLKVEYGEEYGLSFRAQPGVGTSVTIRIPLGTGRA